ncbi:hypothetical protein Hdeb2414_s0002g00080211 [Helianthus debilis subsp. tardiflorus]
MANLLGVDTQKCWNWSKTELKCRMSSYGSIHKSVRINFKVLEVGAGFGRQHSVKKRHSRSARRIGHSLALHHCLALTFR